MAEGAAFALYTCAKRPMRYAVSTPDFNLLVTLDVLLAEGSVARAAQRLRLSPSAMTVLRPAATLDVSQLVRTFTLRTSDGFVENFGPALLTRIAREAPGVRLRFVHKPDKGSTPLRDGSVDLETGVVDSSASPEVLTQA
eukprot:gene20189-23993_t